jgi:hypothetical protein
MCADGDELARQVTQKVSTLTFKRFQKFGRFSFGQMIFLRCEVFQLGPSKTFVLPDDVSGTVQIPPWFLGKTYQFCRVNLT